MRLGLQRLFTPTRPSSVLRPKASAEATTPVLPRRTYFNITCPAMLMPARTFVGSEPRLAVQSPTFRARELQHRLGMNPRLRDKVVVRSGSRRRRAFYGRNPTHCAHILSGHSKRKPM